MPRAAEGRRTKGDPTGGRTPEFRPDEESGQDDNHTACNNDIQAVFRDDAPHTVFRTAVETVATTHDDIQALFDGNHAVETGRDALQTRHASGTQGDRPFGNQGEHRSSDKGTRLDNHLDTPPEGTGGERRERTQTGRA